jgi:predicted RNA polymerase sigma factor
MVSVPSARTTHVPPIRTCSSLIWIRIRLIGICAARVGSVQLVGVRRRSDEGCYQPLHAAHAGLVIGAGDAERAARAYKEVIALTANSVERAELERRLCALR